MNGGRRNRSSAIDRSALVWVCLRFMDQPYISDLALWTNDTVAKQLVLFCYVILREGDRNAGEARLFTQITHGAFSRIYFSYGEFFVVCCAVPSGELGVDNPNFSERSRFRHVSWCTDGTVYFAFTDVFHSLITYEVRIYIPVQVTFSFRVDHHCYICRHIITRNALYTYRVRYPVRTLIARNDITSYC